MASIAEAAEVPVDTVYRYFGNRNEVVLGFYDWINAKVEAHLDQLPEGAVALRLVALLQFKLSLMQPHRKVLRSLAASLLDDDHPLAPQGRATESIRLRGIAAFEQLVRMATDAPKQPAELARLLYGAHWLVLLLFLMDRSANADGVTSLLNRLGVSGSKLPGFVQTLLRSELVKQFGPAVDAVLQVAPAGDDSLAREVLRQVFLHRKLPAADQELLKSPGEACYALHLPKVQRFINAGEPIHLVLPAFPAKSPNPQKVLGALPDLGEEIALQSLQSLCDAIQSIYPPGAQISICADGRVFGALVLITDAQVSAYNTALQNIITEQGHTSLSVLTLEQVVGARDFDAARDWLVATHGEPLEQLHERVRNHAGEQALFNGIHRFIVEDRLVLESEKSKSQIKRESKEIALQVIQRSHAWSSLLDELFPYAVRLSIHPHPASSSKIGIQLTRATDNWITPWHGGMLLQRDEYVLMKRAEMEAMGAEPVYRNGALYYYKAP